MHIYTYTQHSQCGYNLRWQGPVIGTNWGIKSLKLPAGITYPYKKEGPKKLSKNKKNILWNTACIAVQGQYRALPGTQVENKNLLLPPSVCWCSCRSWTCSSTLPSLLTAMLRVSIKSLLCVRQYSNYCTYYNWRIPYNTTEFPFNPISQLYKLRPREARKLVQMVDPGFECRRSGYRASVLTFPPYSSFL